MKKNDKLREIYKLFIPVEILDSFEVVAINEHTINIIIELV